MQLDKPNLELPLAASYNTRGVTGFTNVFTSGLDQRKINSMYEVVVNAITGKATSYLVKRPGVTIDSATLGSSGQVGYLISQRPGSAAPGNSAAIWLFSTSGNDVRASNTSTTTTILTAAGYWPTYVDKTAISGTDTLVIQCTNGGNTQRVFFSSAIATFTEIVDSVFTGLSHEGKMEFMDGFAFILTTNNKIYNSNINTLATWPSTNFITKQIHQDRPLGLMRLNNQIIASGDDTSEVFVNVGNETGSPLKVVKEKYAEVGLIAPRTTSGVHYYANLQDRIYFVGREAHSDRLLMAYDGNAFGPVPQPPAIRKILREATVYSVNKFAVAGQTMIAIGLDLTTATAQRWLVFNPEWKEWFEWNSTVFTPVNASTFHLGVGSNQHRVYSFAASENYQDDSTNYQWLHQFMLPKNGNHRKFMRWCAPAGDTARSPQSITVDAYDDDWQTSTSLGTWDMTSAKPAIYRCGSFRNRGIKLSYTGANSVRLESFLARID